jgi:hypothetical protein
MKDAQLIGLGLLGFGALFFVIGVILLLDRPLLVMSNILIMMGIIVLLTPKGVYGFLAQPGRGQGTIAFVLGIILVFCKLPFPGIICEVTGAYWLFGGFWPLLVSLLLKLPFIGSLIPFLKEKDDQLPM